jgi:hypothetical protein
VLLWPGADPATATGENSITSPDTAGDAGWYTSLVLDASGNPVVSYYDNGPNDLKLLHCNDPNCAGGDESIVAVDTAGFVGEYTSLALDANGNPVVSYQEAESEVLRLLHCNDPNCTGNDESIVTVDTAGNVGTDTSLALDANGNPVVSYYVGLPNQDLRLLHCNDPNCTGGDESITAPDTGGIVGQYTSLALDANGNPVVSYYDFSNGDLKILHCNDPNCDGIADSITSPDMVGNVGQYTSLALDSAGNPVVSYYDVTSGDLKLLHCNDPNCAGGDESIVVADTAGIVGWWTSLVLDAAGNPVVSYQENFSSDLKLLHCGNPTCTNDLDGDGTPNDTDPDDDNDGCSDAAELGTNPLLGGQRNPKNFWDFFDTPDETNTRNRAVNLADALYLLQRFGSEGDPSVDPLSPPPPAPAYHPAFDRTFVGPDSWDLGPANGAISLPDVLMLLAQFGHTCG